MSNRGMQSQAATSVAQFPYDPAHPFYHAGRAMAMSRNDTGARPWNLFLASLPPFERKQAVKQARSANVYNAPSCYHPKPKTYPRGQTASLSKGANV